MVGADAAGAETRTRRAWCTTRSGSSADASTIPPSAEESKHLPFAVVAGDGGFAAIQLGEADDDTSAGRHFAKTSSTIAPEAVGAAILARRAPPPKPPATEALGRSRSVSSGFGSGR